MANIEMKPLAGQSQEEIVQALEVYKKKNPVKYEAKKAALFASYGLNPEAVVEEVKDASDVELEEIKKKVTKKENAK